jgi:thymidylate synthase ThyX
MTKITAKTILRSRNAAAPEKVLSTLLLRYPRFIHAELMTHRAFSRNAASSRAIPVKKIIDDILADTAMPIHWGKNQKGMQASEQHDATIELRQNINDEHLSNAQAWFVARDHAIEVARAFDAAGYHKQVVNRLLEPFMHITVLVSATEWDNFLELRDHPDAEPHIQMLAREVRACLDDDSTVQDLEPGDWHLPFVTELEIQNLFTQDWLKLAVARCASTSYKTVDGFDMTIERAVELHDRLVAARPIHASPAEHVAMADGADRIGYPNDFYYRWHTQNQHGNFVGFRQYRHTLPG